MARAVSSLRLEEVNFLSEIVSNFLCGHIAVSKDILIKLSRLRAFLHKLSSRSVASERRRKLFMSLKGLYTIAQLLPSAIKSIER